MISHFFNFLPFSRTSGRNEDLKLNISATSLAMCMIFILTLSACGSPETSSSSSSSGTVGTAAGKLVTPVVSIVTENGNIYLNWDQSNADQFRVLYWEGNEDPQELVTTDTEYTFPPLAAGSYTILVEAYDSLGNSLFSVPATLEVI